MTLDLRKLTPALLALLATALIALVASPGVTGAAAASGCGPNADASPQSISNGAARDAVICLLNKERSNAGLKPLDRNKQLQKAAQRHNERMVGTGCFDHECGGESDLGKRLESVGYLSGGLTRWAYGENIAWGSGSYGTARSIVAAWMDSPPHRANILSNDFRDIGIGFTAGTPTSGRADGATYTTDFGLRIG
jgi:uncharacterized protein YkwD